MVIRNAQEQDLSLLVHYDKHIAEKEMGSLISLNRVVMVEDNGQFVGWLRWGLFWDNIPFMNMLYFLEEYRGRGYGTKLVTFWENQMRNQGYHLVMTSSQSHETAQHFYRKLNYKDSGALLLKNEPLEIIFTKEI